MDLCDSIIPEFVSPATGLMACAEPTWWLFGFHLGLSHNVLVLLTLVTEKFGELLAT